VAEKLTPEATFLGGKFSDNGYAKVGVDRVLDTWEDLELDVQGLDGEETTLGAVVHGWILWLKSHIKITEPASPPPSAMP